MIKSLFLFFENIDFIELLKIYVLLSLPLIIPLMFGVRDWLEYFIIKILMFIEDILYELHSRGYKKTLIGLVILVFILLRILPYTFMIFYAMENNVPSTSRDNRPNNNLSLPAQTLDDDDDDITAIALDALEADIITPRTIEALNAVVPPIPSVPPLHLDADTIRAMVEEADAIEDLEATSSDINNNNNLSVPPLDAIEASETEDSAWKDNIKRIRESEELDVAQRWQQTWDASNAEIERLRALQRQKEHEDNDPMTIAIKQEKTDQLNPDIDPERRPIWDQIWKDRQKKVAEAEIATRITEITKELHKTVDAEITPEEKANYRFSQEVYDNTQRLAEPDPNVLVETHVPRDYDKARNPEHPKYNAAVYYIARDYDDLAHCIARNSDKLFRAIENNKDPYDMVDNSIHAMMSHMQARTNRYVPSQEAIDIAYQNIELEGTEKYHAIKFQTENALLGKEATLFVVHEQENKQAVYAEKEQSTQQAIYTALSWREKNCLGTISYMEYYKNMADYDDYIINNSIKPTAELLYNQQIREKAFKLYDVVYELTNEFRNDEGVITEPEVVESLARAEIIMQKRFNQVIDCMELLSRQRAYGIVSYKEAMAANLVMDDYCNVLLKCMEKGVDSGVYVIPEVPSWIGSFPRLQIFDPLLLPIVEQQIGEELAGVAKHSTNSASYKGFKQGFDDVKEEFIDQVMVASATQMITSLNTCEDIVNESGHILAKSRLIMVEECSNRLENALQAGSVTPSQYVTANAVMKEYVDILALVFTKNVKDPSGNFIIPNKPFWEETYPQINPVSTRAKTAVYYDAVNVKHQEWEADRAVAIKEAEEAEAAAKEAKEEAEMKLGLISAAGVIILCAIYYYFNG